MRTARVLAVLCALVVGACGEDAPPQHEATLYVFGTKVDILLRDVDADTAGRATTRLESEFKRLHTRWHAWKPGALTDLNRALAQGRAHTVTPDLAQTLVQARELAALSDGMFDPAIGAIVGAWGFHADDRPDVFHPDLDAIRALAARRPRMADVRIDGTTVSTANTAARLDFGAFAKGAALDRAEAILSELGVEHALINAGGDLNTMGSGGNRPWTVAIRDPDGWGVIARLTLTPGEDVYTSGNYERFIEADGVRYAHIIDPRTGMPVRHIVSATVVTRNGALADAAATALSVAGPEDWHRIAKRMGVKFAVLVDDQGTVHLNPAMRRRLTFKPGRDVTVRESPPL